MLLNGGWSSVLVFNAPLVHVSFFFLLSLSFFLCVIYAVMAALENEVLRNPKPSLVDRSALELSTDKLVPPDIYVDRALLRARVEYDDVCEADVQVRGHKSSWSDFTDSDMDLVVEAKARIQDLQKEAETLEEAYRNYQQRAVHSTISHLLPPRTISLQPAHPLHHLDSHLRKHISPHSHTHSTHKSKVSHTPSQQTIRTLSSLIPPAQPRVTFSEDQNQPVSTVSTDDGLSLATQCLFMKDGGPQDGSSSPSRPLSSRLNSSSGKKLQREISEGI